MSEQAILWLMDYFKFGPRQEPILRKWIVDHEIDIIHAANICFQDSQRDDGNAWVFFRAFLENRPWPSTKP